jgi:hypothetical protein
MNIICLGISVVFSVDLTLYKVEDKPNLSRIAGNLRATIAAKYTADIDRNQFNGGTDPNYVIFWARYA